MISATEILQYLGVATDKTSKDLSAQLEKIPEDQREMAKFGFQEIVNTHVDLIRFFAFVELIESNNNDISYLDELITEHINSADEMLKESTENIEMYNKLLHTQKIWVSIREKFDMYMKLLNPIAQ